MAGTYPRERVSPSGTPDGWIFDVTVKGPMECVAVPEKVSSRMNGIATTVTIRITHTQPYHLWPVHTVEYLDATGKEDRYILHYGFKDLFNHYQIQPGWTLIFWVRTPDIIDMQIRKINMDEILYGRPPHGETEPIIPIAPPQVSTPESDDEPEWSWTDSDYAPTDTGSDEACNTSVSSTAGP